jgi:hypothetical protein
LIRTLGASRFEHWLIVISEVLHILHTYLGTYYLERILNIHSGTLVQSRHKFVLKTGMIFKKWFTFFIEIIFNLKDITCMYVGTQQKPWICFLDIHGHYVIWGIVFRYIVLRKNFKLRTNPPFIVVRVHSAKLKTKPLALRVFKFHLRDSFFTVLQFA